MHDTMKKPRHKTPSAAKRARSASRADEGDRQDKGRWSSRRKTEVVLRLFRGETLDALSRELGVTPGKLERYLRFLKAAGRSARTLNFARQNVVAFYEWCVKVGRAASNPLSCVPKQDELRDRRRVRRPLSDHELGRLLAVARREGREAWYLAAVFAGLRKGDLQRLQWADVDLASNTITITEGKARRRDVIPMHPQLASALRDRRTACRPAPNDRIWPHTVTDRTRMRDFLEAGIARRVQAPARPGRPAKWKIVTEDEHGRVADLHALRMTLGTSLARAGVAPQVAQRLMRHSDYKTTMTHYTALGLRDVAAAVEALPAVAVSDCSVEGRLTHHQLFPQQLGCERAPQLASARELGHHDPTGRGGVKSLENTTFPRFAARGEGKRAKGFEPSTFSLGS